MRGHWGFAPRPKGCSPPPCGGLKIAFWALCSVNGCPIIPTTWGLSAYCPLTHTGTLAAICRTKSTLFDAFWCFSVWFWCSLAAGLHTAQRLPAAAGRTAGGSKGAGRCAPRRQQGSKAQPASRPCRGRAFAPRRQQGAAASRDRQQQRAHSPRPREAACKRSEPQQETPRPREGAAQDGAAAAQQPRDRPTARRSSPAPAAQYRPQGEGGKDQAGRAAKQPPPRQTQQEQRRRGKGGRGIPIRFPPRIGGSERAAARRNGSSSSPQQCFITRQRRGGILRKITRQRFWAVYPLFL